MKSDNELKRDVENELKWAPYVNEAHIGVSVKSGVVTLSGHVPSFVEKHAAERAAKRIYGVLAVADEIDVKLPRSAKRSDEDIAQACLTALKSNNSVPDSKIKVIVRSGHVFLEGQVDWQYERTAAQKAVQDLTGVTAVTNNIELKTVVSPQDVKDRIVAAFHRNADIDARRISIEANDGKIVLRGNVRSWAERDEAQEAAWSAPGVTMVENDIVVTP